MTYFIDTSDRRNKYLLEMLNKENFHALEYNENTYVKVNNNDCIVFSPAKKINMNLVEGLHNSITIFAGNINKDLESLLKEKNITHINLMNDEIFTIKNANLTCEGILSLMISETDSSIFESNVLILGGGRIARAMALLLNKINVKFSMVSFNEVKFPQYYIYTNSCYYKKSFIKDLKEFDILINTIPAKIFDEEDLKYFRKDSVLIETASENCLNKEIVKDFKYILAPALPSKFTPKTAARFMMDSIVGLNNYKEII